MNLDKYTPDELDNPHADVPHISEVFMLGAITVLLRTTHI